MAALFDFVHPPSHRGVCGAVAHRYDDVLLELYHSGVEIFSVTYKEPGLSPFAKLGLGATAAAAGGRQQHYHQRGWLPRVVAAAIGLPLPPTQLPAAYHTGSSVAGVGTGTSSASPPTAWPPGARRHEPHFRDPRF